MTDFNTLQSAVNAEFDVLHPDLAIAQRRRDPVYLAAEVAALATVMNPGATEAELMKDPNFRAQRLQGMQALADALKQAQARP